MSFGQEQGLPVHDSVPVMCDAVFSLAQVTRHCQGNLETGQGKAFQGNNFAAGVQNLSIAGCQPYRDGQVLSTNRKWMQDTENLNNEAGQIYR